VTRKSTGKRLRFEVLKRDGFKCHYCGITSAAEVLVVDHVVPVAEGGTTEAANLVTACIPCNGGKSSVPLDKSDLDEPTPTDAMIEHAEQMRAYLAAVREREAVVEELADYVREEWGKRVGYLNEDTRVAISFAVQKVGIDRALEAIAAVARSAASGSHGRLLYFQGVIRKMQRDD